MGQSAGRALVSTLSQPCLFGEAGFADAVVGATCPEGFPHHVGTDVARPLCRRGREGELLLLEQLLRLLLSGGSLVTSRGGKYESLWNQAYFGQVIIIK